MLKRFEKPFYGLLALVVLCLLPVPGITSGPLAGGAHVPFLGGPYVPFLSLWLKEINSPNPHKLEMVFHVVVAWLVLFGLITGIAFLIKRLAKR